ncbi:tudor domain-containing protein 3 [Elysia marginata]|uniref:Tudor domain-containing protein 3 n=1 Tax=Elysia marginata TaxID=1093978 RepID=A0AAV4HHG8_9GAST|nr:tudor domain-containing protein 3 [Elysia marginata]
MDINTFPLTWQSLEGPQLFKSAGTHMTHIKEDSLETFDAQEKGSKDAILKRILNTDLRDIGASWLDEDINRSKLDYVIGPAVLQLQKLRVVSAPKENEESQAAPKLCRLSLTDGHVTCSAVTLEPIKGIGVNTAPGTKVLLSGTIEVETSFLLLTGNNFRLLGGRVESLAEPWELKKTLAKQSLTRARGEGGPPPFVPFGKKIGKNPPPSFQKDNFKSLSTSKDKKAPESESEFEQQRQAEIKQALQAKSTSGGVKTFGGGNKAHINDRDVARITEMGFSAEQATAALRTSAGNVEEAIHQLLSGGPRYQRGGERGGGRGPGRGGGGGGEGGGRRGRRERDNDDDGDALIKTRPSGPATLFDFLETKIPAKEGKKASSSISKNVNQSTNISSSLSTPQDKLYNEPYQNKSNHPPQKPGNDTFSQRCSYRDGIQRDYNNGRREAANNSSQYHPQKAGQESSSQRCAYRDGIHKDNSRGGRVAGGNDSRRNQFESNQGDRGDRAYGQQQQSDIPPRFAKSGQQQRSGGQYNRDRVDSGQYNTEEHQGGYNKGTRDGQRGGGHDRRFDNAAGQEREAGRYNNAGEPGRHDREGVPGGYRAGSGRQDAYNNSHTSPSPQYRPPLTENSSRTGNLDKLRQENPAVNRPKPSVHSRDENMPKPSVHSRDENRPKPSVHSRDENRPDTGKSQGDSYSSNDNHYKGSYHQDQKTNNIQFGEGQNRRKGYQDHNSRTNGGYARQDVTAPGNRTSSQNFGGRESQLQRDGRGGGQPPRFNKRSEHYNNGQQYNPSHQGPMAHSSHYQDSFYGGHQFNMPDCSGVSIGDTVLAKYWEDGKRRFLHYFKNKNKHKQGTVDCSNLFPGKISQCSLKLKPVKLSLASTSQYN